MLYLYELIKFDVLECKCVIDVLVNQYRCILTLFSRAHKSLMILLIALNLSLVPQKRNCCWCSLICLIKAAAIVIQIALDIPMFHNTNTFIVLFSSNNLNSRKSKLMPNMQGTRGIINKNISTNNLNCHRITILIKLLAKKP